MCVLCTFVLCGICQEGLSLESVWPGACCLSLLLCSIYHPRRSQNLATYLNSKLHHELFVNEDAKNPYLNIQPTGEKCRPAEEYISWFTKKILGKIVRLTQKMAANDNRKFCGLPDKCVSLSFACSSDYQHNGCMDRHRSYTLRAI